jgi:eukaryotic-like serine/threonine-protein kinase
MSTAMATSPSAGGLIPIGRGPVAVVYTGIDQHGDTAVKVFPNPFDRGTKAAFDHEQARLATLRHVPSILQVSDVRKLSDGRPALCMPRCSQSLAQRVERVGRLAVEDALALGEAVALALAAAHRVGVTHGAVTPRNVLLRSSGEPVLADFGVAIRQQFTRDPLYEVDYVAPDTLRDGTMSEWCDLYGLGAVLYLALTGRSPHPARVGEQPAELILRVLNEPVATIGQEDVPAELSTVVASLLAKDPGQRPPDAAAIADLLTSMRRTNPTVAADVGESGPPRTARVIAPTLPATPVAIAKPSQGERERARYGRLIAITAGVALVASVPVVLSRTDDAPPAGPPPAQNSPAAPAPDQTRAVQLELDPPTDHGSYVDLVWRSAEDLDFAVVVAADGQDQPEVILANRNRTLRVPVDPRRKYCFTVRATNNRADRPVYESQPKPIRGASCGR